MRRVIAGGVAILLTLLPATAAYASQASHNVLSLSVQPGALIVSSTVPSSLSSEVGNHGSGYLPTATWGDTTGTGNGWQGTVAATDFIYTGSWEPSSGSPALSTNFSSSYTGSVDGDTYTVTVTGVSGSTVDFSYASSNGAAGTGTATAGSPANVGSHGLTIEFSSGITYASGNRYFIHVGAQNPNALTLSDTQNPNIIEATAQTLTSPPVFINQTASVTGGTSGQYGAAVPLLSAAQYAGMSTYKIQPEGIINTDINSWAANYVSDMEYTISSGPSSSASTSGSSTTPVVTGVTVANMGQNATLIIQGSGFGTLPSSDLGMGTTPYFGLGYGNGLQAGHTYNATLTNYASWSNNRIIIKGLSDSYYMYNWALTPGGEFNLLIENPQSSLSANYYGYFPAIESAPPGAPIIKDVSVTNYGQSGMTVTVTGSGFGTQPNTLPYTGNELYAGITASGQQVLGNSYNNSGPLTYTVWSNTEVQMQVPSSKLSLFNSSVPSYAIIGNAYGDAPGVAFN